MKTTLADITFCCFDRDDLERYQVLLGTPNESQ